MNQLQEQELQFQADYQFLQNNLDNGSLIQLKTVFGPEGCLRYDQQNHMICKLLNLNQYHYANISDLGIEKFQDLIQQYRNQLRIHEASINNFGVIHYVHQGQLPLFYYHSDWDFTLYNSLYKLQQTGKQMNQDTLYWIIRQLAYIINLQHENGIYQFNTSIENIVFKQYFNFIFIRFYQQEVEGQLEKFYRFIISNFRQNQYIEKMKQPQLQKVITEQFSSSDSQYILNFNTSNQPDRTSQVQVFLYQLSLYAGSFNYTIYDIDYVSLVRHHTLQIANFDSAVQIDPQLGNQQVNQNNLQILPQHLQHPHNLQQNGPQQQDYYCLGIVLGQIYMVNYPYNNILIQTQTGNKMDINFLQQFLPNNFIGLFNQDINAQEQAFENIQNLQFIPENVQNLEYFTQEEINDSFQQQ